MSALLPELRTTDFIVAQLRLRTKTCGPQLSLVVNNGDFGVKTVSDEAARRAKLKKWCARNDYSAETLADVLETMPDDGPGDISNRVRAMAVRIAVG
jgi:hypothetical protein